MRRAAFLLFLILVIVGMSWPQASAHAQDAPTPTESPSAQTGDTPTPQLVSATLKINYPPTGETLRGPIPITGTIPAEGFTRWELAFAHADNPTDTWFLLASGVEPISGQLATWDTTLLTDGDYLLRLRVQASDAYQEVLIERLRIANYTVHTATPTSTQPPTITATATPTPLPPTATITATPTIRPSSTPLPPNPAILDGASILFNLAQAVTVVFAVFAFFGAILWLRRPRR